MLILAERKSSWTEEPKIHAGISKRWRSLVLALFVGILLLYIWPFADDSALPMEVTIELTHAQPLPAYPFEEYHHREHQAFENLPMAKNQKYLFVGNHVFHQGFGNALQEHIMNALLAWASGRKLVVSNFTTWPGMDQEFVIEKFYGEDYVPARIPWSAIMTGPLFVDINSVDPDPLHRPITVRRYREQCPQPVYVNSSEANAPYPDREPQNRIPSWVDYLEQKHGEEQCLETVSDPDRPFNFDAFAFRNILKLYPLLQRSGILNNFGFSDNIIDIFETNKDLFVSNKWRLPALGWEDLGKTSRPFNNLMVVHIRQGDWEQHCMNVMQMWGFQGFNTFDGFKDSWVGPTSPENREATMERCFPSLQAMADKIAQVRTREITHLYIMTNGSPKWVKQFKAVLYTTQKWSKISSTHDLLLTRDQVWIAQVFDLYIGRRAGVFIGNGWSSLTSSISLIRVNDGHMKTTRFW